MIRAAGLSQESRVFPHSWITDGFSFLFISFVLCSYSECPRGVRSHLNWMRMVGHRSGPFREPERRRSRLDSVTSISPQNSLYKLPSAPTTSSLGTSPDPPHAGCVEGYPIIGNTLDFPSSPERKGFAQLATKYSASLSSHISWMLNRQGFRSQTPTSSIRTSSARTHSSTRLMLRLISLGRSPRRTLTGWAHSPCTYGQGTVSIFRCSEPKRIWNHR